MGPKVLASSSTQAQFESHRRTGVTKRLSAERFATAAPYWQKGALLLAQTTSPISLELGTYLHYLDPGAEALCDVAKILQGGLILPG